MTKHLQTDLDGVSKEPLTMGAMVEEATTRAINARERRDKTLAREVIAVDDAVNDCENRIEDHALKILALHQPVAADLRFIITVLFISRTLDANSQSER